ncbi:hypothetical protein [Tissierella sp.]|uniref:hypothetical protein n=1 Tax=Tissierella sp. TaxID=41274 RepID=UPI003062ED4E
MEKKDKEILINRGPQSSFIIAINGPLDSFIDTCNLYEIKPSSTFKSSITVKEVTYAIFNTDTSINDLRMCYVIQGCLNRLFNSYKNISQFKKALKEEFRLYPNLMGTTDKTDTVDYEAAFIDIPYLVYAACFAVRNKFSQSNAARKLDAFLLAINLNKSIMQAKKRSAIKSTDSCDEYKYILEEKHNSVEFTFTINTTDFINSFDSKSPKNNCNAFNVEPTRPKRDESIDVDLLIANDSTCKLLKELCSGSRKLSMSELNHLAKSLCTIDGAMTALLKAIKATGLYNDTIESFIDYLIGCYKRNGYGERPPLCSYSCSHHKSCNLEAGHQVSYLRDVSQQKLGTIRRINNTVRSYKDKETIRAEITDSFNNDCNTEDNRVFVYKCFVGLGKTHIYLNKIQEFIESNKTVIIAVPSHALKDDIVLRLREDHLSEDLIAEKVIIVPKIPDAGGDFNKELNSLYSVGDYSGASKFIRDYADNLTTDHQDIKDDLNDYLDIISNLKIKEYTDGKIIITTHERLFSLKVIDPDLVIIDEDITDSILKIQQVGTDELTTLKLKIENIMKSGEVNDSLNAILDKINSILIANNDILYSTTANDKDKGKLHSTILKYITEDRGVYYNSRITDLLFNSCTYVKSTDPENEGTKSTIHYIYKRNLPFNCKVFIMSATSDKKVCERLLGQEKVVFREFDIPKLRANIVFYTDYSYSKEWFKRHVSNLEKHVKSFQFLRDTKLCTKAKKNVPRVKKNQPLIITFKECEKYFEDLGFDTLMHFGNTTGIDTYKGKNIAVFGTYNLNPIVYTLYTQAVFPEEPIYEVPKYSNVLVENKDYEFNIYTSEEFDKFRKIQLWKIQSEIIQALGRARPIDENCFIAIYSNVPIDGIDIALFSKR